MTITEIHNQAKINGQLTKTRDLQNTRSCETEQRINDPLRATPTCVQQNTTYGKSYEA